MRLHLHWFKLIEDDPNFDWGGVVCRRRVWGCLFCSARKATVSGRMPI